MSIYKYGKFEKNKKSSLNELESILIDIASCYYGLNNCHEQERLKQYYTPSYTPDFSSVGNFGMHEFYASQKRESNSMRNSHERNLENNHKKLDDFYKQHPNEDFMQFLSARRSFYSNLRHNKDAKEDTKKHARANIYATADGINKAQVIRNRGGK